MTEIWLQTLALFGLAVVTTALWLRVRHIEFKLDQTQDWVSRDISRIERLERLLEELRERQLAASSPSRSAATGRTEPVLDEIVMKHRDIQA